MLIPIAHAAQLNYVVFDFETTGIDAKVERITQVSAVRVRQGRIINEQGILEFLRAAPFGTVTDRSDFFSTLVNPERPISQFIHDLTGIDDAMVAEAPMESDVIPAFARYIDGGVMVAHNGLAFDILFLIEACKRQGIEPPARSCLDTLRICRKIDLQCADLGYSLSASLERHRVLIEDDLNLHNALVDALLTARLWIHFMNILHQRRVDGIYVL